MKLLTYRHGRQERTGYLSEDETKIIDLKDIGIDNSSMNELIETLSLEELLDLREEAKKNGTEERALEKAISLADVKLLSPIPRPRQDVICLGINYAAHAEESARYKKEAFNRETYPIYFAKRVNEAVADGDPVDAHSEMFKNLDYEAELAVIIGKSKKDTGICRNVKGEDASKHIFGYTILNDISAREIQTRHKQWYFGKSLDAFTPIGPWIVTADEIAYPPELAIRSYVNGELRQDSNTNLLINDIDYIIEELSQGMTLLPASIISTGTPAGVGMGFEPPKFMKPGDVVICEIEKIGKITNPIEDMK